MTFNLSRIVYGLLFSTIIGGIAYWRGSLTRSGWLGAIVTGTATFGFGGWSWGLLLITFFTTSSLLSRYKEGIKAARAGEKFEKGGKRDFGQTMANGGVAALLAVLYPLLGQSDTIYIAYIGVLATVTADTWATELGVLSARSPRLVTTWRRVEPGTSGAITLFGTSTAALGGLTIGCAALLFALLEQLLTHTAPVIWPAPLLGLLGGLTGALFDSLLGATVQAIYTNQKGQPTERPKSQGGVPHQLTRGFVWVNNDAVNLISSLVGGYVAILLSQLLA